MTNDTKAPERIWAWPKGSWFTAGASDHPVKAAGAIDVEYVRADLALAAQGALIERAAETCWHGLHTPEDPMDEYGWIKADTPERHASAVLEWNLWKTSEAIRALSPDATAALEAVRREAVEQERAKVEVATMRLSGGREEYYVRILCGGRSVETRRYGQGYRNRAEYEADMLRHVLLGEPEPDIMDSKYADQDQALTTLAREGQRFDEET